MNRDDFKPTGERFDFPLLRNDGLVFTVRLDPKRSDALYRIARVQGASVQDVVRDAIHTYLDQRAGTPD